MTRRSPRSNRFDTIVVGGGQAGLAMGRLLQRAGRGFLILDAAARPGDAWRQRWDSLRLFTPARYDALPDLPFPAPPDHLPGKDEVAEYLESYARTFSLPLALDERVREVRRLGPREFRVATGHAEYRARNVVVATGGYTEPQVPRFAPSLDERIAQLHSSAYRSPSQVGEGPVVVVGAGNSGVQVAAELAAHSEVTLAPGTPMPTLPTRLLGRSIFDWLEITGAMRLTVGSPIARRLARREVRFDVSPTDLARTRGVRLATRIVGAGPDGLHAADGRRLPARTVIWATGFRPSYPWLRVPVLDALGRPRHVRGLTEIPGLMFLGLPWQHTRGSSLLGWVARDAAHLVRALGDN